MKRSIRLSKVSGRVAAPPSKSIAQRAIAMAVLARGKSVLHNVGSSNDCRAAMEVGRAFGADISGSASRLVIQGGSLLHSPALHCGESGLLVRMFSAIAATRSEPITLTGEGSLLARPMDAVVDGLRQLGVDCSATNGRLPIRVCGPLRGGRVRVDGSVTSQGITGMLLAAPLADSEVTIEVVNPASKPYIDLTLALMRKFGIEVDCPAADVYRIPAPQLYKPQNLVVEGDWSGAAFLLVAGAIAGSVTVSNLNSDSKQADRAILEVLKRVGATVQIESDKIAVTRNRLLAFDFDATHCPDLFPPLAVLAACCSGVSKIKGVGRLRVKESDRAEALSVELARLGIDIRIDGDMMLVVGGTPKPGTVSSRNDHRIAMAGAVAALRANGPVEIAGAEAIAKSYPEFYADLERLAVG